MRTDSGVREEIFERNASHLKINLDRFVDKLSRPELEDFSRRIDKSISTYLSIKEN